MRPYYLASDVHLGAVPAETERRFLAFLERAGRDGSGLLLAGDLFDFWFEWGEVVPGRHFRVLAALAELVDAGVPVTLLGGNHDWWGGRFLRDEVGVAFHRGPVRLELAGRRALAVHGDGVGRGDLGYRLLKGVLRSRVAIAGFRALHPELGVRLARAVSGTEGRGQGGAAAAWRARHIEVWAFERLEAEPELELVVCGHAHLPAVREAGPGRWYVNPGDWIEHDSYVVLAPGEPPELRRWGEE